VNHDLKRDIFTIILKGFLLPEDRLVEQDFQQSLDHVDRLDALEMYTGFIVNLHEFLNCILWKSV